MDHIDMTQIDLGLDMDIIIVIMDNVSAILVTCIKQHLSIIWSSIHEKVKQHWDWVEKKSCL